MDDWKLSAVTVVRLEKELNTLVSLVTLLYVQGAFKSFEPNLITRKHINDVTFETQRTTHQSEWLTRGKS